MKRRKYNVNETQFETFSKHDEFATKTKKLLWKILNLNVKNEIYQNAEESCVNFFAFLHDLQ